MVVANFSNPSRTGDLEGKGDFVAIARGGGTVGAATLPSLISRLFHTSFGCILIR